MAGPSPSKTGVNDLSPGHPRLYRADLKTWMPGTRPGMTDAELALPGSGAPPARGDQSLIGGTGGALPGAAGAAGGTVAVAAAPGTVAVASGLVPAWTVPAGGATAVVVPVTVSGFCEACSVGRARGSGGNCGRAGAVADGMAGCDNCPGAPSGPIPVGAPYSVGEA